MKNRILKSITTSISRHSSEILICLGITGMISGSVMVGKATPKALLLIEQEKKEQNKKELTTQEKIKTVWKCYIPAVATEAVSIVCIVGANSINAKRNAALATAYSISETALRTYQDKVVEVIGEKKEQEIHDAIAKDQVKANPISAKEIVLTQKGDTLCFDPLSGRYFRSDINKLQWAENELNRQMRDDMTISLNEFYGAIGLSGLKVGEDLGWNINRGYINLRFSATLAEGETPCIVVEHVVAPKYGYQDCY